MIAILDSDNLAPAPIAAALTYSVPTGERPIAETRVTGMPTVYSNENTADHNVAIHDIRPIADQLSLDRHGFVLTQHETRVTDFYDETELREIYYPEIEDLLMSLAGAVRRVHTFDHTLRHGDEAVQEARRLREPVKMVHNDYTDWSGPERVRDLLPDEVPNLRQQRFAIIQVWRPIQEVIQQQPLAICDARTIASGDLIAAERRHPKRIGETYHIAFNPDHRWFYVPEMKRNEALVFKTYESATDGRARFTGHTSFEDPNSPIGARPRESIEVRALVFFED